MNVAFFIRHFTERGTALKSWVIKRFNIILMQNSWIYLQIFNLLLFPERIGMHILNSHQNMWWTYLEHTFLKNP